MIKHFLNSSGGFLLLQMFFRNFELFPQDGGKNAKKYLHLDSEIFIRH